MKNVLLLKAGEANLATRELAGDYDRWFLQTASEPGVRFELRRPYLGEPLPKSAREYDAVWMTGSPLSVTDPAEWMIRSGEFMREAAEQGIPVLGVCFGHQLLGLAYGASVQKNPRGREIGTVEVELSEAGKKDFLFEGIPERFTAQATHEDELPSLPEGATLLATNGLSAIQAMALGDHVRGVQFHPEMPTDGMRAVILARAERLDQEGQRRTDPVGERLAGVGEFFGSRVITRIQPG